MKYALTLLILLYASVFAQAQKTIKTQFLVIGTTAAGIGAGVQAAKSGIKTLIIDSTTVLGRDVGKIDTTFTLGLDGRFLSERKSGLNTQKILKHWLAEQKSLKLLTRVRVNSLVKVKDGWELKLSNGQRVLANWVFEDTGPQIEEYAPGKFIENYDVSITTDNWSGFLYRTQVGVSRGNNSVNSYPLSRFIKTEKENWLVIPAVGKSFSTGQIVGAMAANTVANDSRDFQVRGIQKSLFAEGLYLDGLNDLKLDDPHFMAMERVFATGLLRPSFYMPGGMMAQPEGRVEIKNIINAFMDYYKNSAFWFEKHPMGKMSIAEALELLFVITHASLDAQIQSDWNGKLDFKSTYSPERAITRREFAVLVDVYLKPFDIEVDMNGSIHR